MEKKIPLIAVVGPTASGKTKLGVALAKAYNGEVVSADSMQIYAQMDIATAKPTLAEMEGVPHHLISFLPPEQAFSLAEYVAVAEQVIAKIHHRGKTPILVGGTGLYVTTLLDHIALSEQGEDAAVRAELTALASEKGNAFLLEELRKIDPECAQLLHENNLTRIVRAIEVYRLTGVPMSVHVRNSRLTESPYNFCMVGINYKNRQQLYDRINLRVDQMMVEGLLQEAEEVRKTGRKTAAQAIGYKELEPYFLGQASLESCIASLKQSTRRYAKRQLTWFRRDERVQWVYPDECTNFSEIVNNSRNIVANSRILC